VLHNIDGTFNYLTLKIFLDNAIELYEKEDTIESLSEKLCDVYNKTLAFEQDEIRDLLVDHWNVICE
jgi:hypothetical protein